MTFNTALSPSTFASSLLPSSVSSHTHHTHSHYTLHTHYSSPTITTITTLRSIHTPHTHSSTMSTEWSLDFCLVCDRQTLGAPYCSQTCRLAELDVENSSRRSSEASTHWSETAQAQSTLSASSSQTSLASLKSNESHVTDRLQDELRDYASCFDQVRDLKRRMTTT